MPVIQSYSFFDFAGHSNENNKFSFCEWCARSCCCCCCCCRCRRLVVVRLIVRSLNRWLARLCDSLCRLKKKFKSKQTKLKLISIVFYLILIEIHQTHEQCRTNIKKRVSVTSIVARQIRSTKIVNLLLVRLCAMCDVRFYCVFL